MTTPPDTPRAAASRAMLAVVDAILRDGISGVPERTTFVDADGTQQVLEPRAPAAA